MSDHLDRLRELDQSAEPDARFARHLEARLRRELSGRVERRRRWRAPLTAVAAFAATLVAVAAIGLLGDERATIRETPELAAPRTTGEDQSPGSGAAQSDAGDGWDTLPDGTRYRLSGDPRPDEEVTGIHGVIVVDLDDGTSPVLGTARFARGAGGGPERMAFPSGGWTMTLDVDVEVFGAMEPDAADTLRSSIRPLDRSGLPAFELAPPLRWADDNEVPAAMEVLYETFSVRRACGPQAVACSETGAVQVIPLEEIAAPAPEWSGEEVWIESDAPRPRSDGTFVDPGPLSPRGGHVVAWTGGRMLVYGGRAAGDEAPLRDGAVFDPASSQWSTIAPGPAPPGLSAARWTGAELLVVDEDATTAYDPGDDRWRRAGEGLAGIVELEVSNGTVFAWNREGVHRLDDGRWVSLQGGPGGADADSFFANLVDVGGRLHAVRVPGGRCSGKRLWEWSGDHWTELPAVTLESGGMADCSLANQVGVASGDLLAWEDESHPTVRYDRSTGTWFDVERIPLPGTEAPSGPLSLDESRLLVPQWGNAALWDAERERWDTVRLPGSGTGSEMVWSGAEVLRWGSSCCSTRTVVDAWRWVPPG